MFTRRRRCTVADGFDFHLQSDYFSVGVNTGNGLSMLLIPRGEGVETKLIKTSYSTAAGTAYITFDNVKVPVENLLGKEGKGIYVILR